MNIQNKLKDCVTDVQGMDPHVIIAPLLFLVS
jgi:hypothetical protein